VDVVAETLIIDQHRIEHIARHNVTVAEVVEVVSGDYVYIQGHRDRWLLVGKTAKGRLLTVAPKQDHLGEALANLRTAHELNPNDVNVLGVLGWCEAITGNASRGIEHLLEALRRAPRDPLRYAARTNLAIAYSLAKDYAKTVDYALLASNEAPNFALSHVMLAVGYVGLGEIDKAKASLEKARDLAPEYVQGRLDGAVPYRDPKAKEQFTIFLRVAAGLDAPAAADRLR
jgi:tetratricopeptide (TPR) repeat protein